METVTLTKLEKAEQDLFQASGNVSYWITNTPETKTDHRLMAFAHSTLKRAAIAYAEAVQK